MTFRRYLMQFCIGLTCAFLSFQIWAQTASPNCDLDIEKSIQEKTEYFKKIYNKLDTKNGFIKTKNESLFLSGKNGRAILLQHGFVASPFEVLYLATYFHSKGYTVYAPLLFGFGSSGLIANTVSYKNWIQDFEENVTILKKCYSKVELVGFSLGATLAVNYAQNHSENVESLVLLSPFYEFSQSMLTGIAQFATIFTSEISIRKLYNLTGVSDLRALIKYPFFYNSTFPLYAAQEVVELGKLIQKQYNQIKKGTSIAMSIPNITIYSQSDMTINRTYASEFPKLLFARPIVKPIESVQKVPHQITLPEFNPKFKETLELISTLNQF